MSGTGSGIELIERAAGHVGRTAIVDADGRHGYGDLLRASEAVARGLLDRAGTGDLAGERVACMVDPGLRYAAVQWGVWRAGGIAVPLCLFHPPRELAYVLDDTSAALAVADPGHRDPLEGLADERDVPFLGTGALLATGDTGGGAGSDRGAGPAAGPGAGADAAPETSTAPAAPDDLPTVAPDRPALILYTSGTTGRPKGVVHTHATLRAQITSLVEAWGWRPGDEILHVLPLHHTHGLVNALLCALWTGASCRMRDGFDAADAWRTMAETPVTLFMGVPTMYVQLIRRWREADDARREELSAAARGLRLAVSGSAALPVPVFEAWEEIAGGPLLERYGMTEIGMALSNPLEGERRPGHVGRPLPGVEVRLTDEDGDPIHGDETPGEIEVRGPNVFREYWERPETTREAFREGGWFVTGDEAELRDGYYRILGRKSVDIIITGGYKVSALEVEEVLLRHPAVESCAVVGVDDPEWGERVCAAVVGSGVEPVPELAELRRWGKERLAPYKVPTRMRQVEALPRNAVGKVTKPDVEAMFGDGGEG